MQNQNAKRYYIVKGDDRPVVRTVPVAAHRAAAAPQSRPAAEATVVAPGAAGARVSRLVRAAVRRPRGR